MAATVFPTLDRLQDTSAWPAYQARRVTTAFGFDSIDFFGKIDILTLAGSDRAGICQYRWGGSEKYAGCHQPAPYELHGNVYGVVSGHPLLRSARTCALHFWDNVDHVLWLR